MEKDDRSDTDPCVTSEDEEAEEPKVNGYKMNGPENLKARTNGTAAISANNNLVNGVKNKQEN